MTTRGSSALRVRVQQAIERPVSEAEKLLSDLGDANAETRLSILISGWGRGIASALEELAIAIDELHGQDENGAAHKAQAQPAVTQAEQETVADAQSERSAESDATDANDERLGEEAKRSREATAALKEETEQARRELER